MAEILSPTRYRIPSERTRSRTVVETHDKYSSKKEFRSLGVRYILGVSLIEKTLYGKKTKIVSKKEREERHTMGRGTPGKARPKEPFTTFWKSFWITQRQSLSLKPTMLQLSANEAQSVLKALLEVAAPENVDKLSFALTKFVEEQALLAGYSSGVIAVACRRVAEQALWKRILTTRVPKELSTNKHAIRHALDSLWLQRDKYDNMVREHGGSVGRLQVPFTAKGKVNVKLFQADNVARGLAGPNETGLKRVAKGRAGGSPLKAMELPPPNPT